MQHVTQHDFDFAFNYFRKRGVKINDAEDMAQESLRKAWQAWDSSKQFKPFLAHACKSVLADSRDLIFKRSLKVTVTSFTDLEIKSGEIIDDSVVTPWRTAQSMIYGSDQWTPEREGNWTDGNHVIHKQKHTAMCDVCGGENGPIQKGSGFCCGACHRSGIDHVLKADLRKSIKKRKAIAKGKSLAQRLARKRGSK